MLIESLKFAQKHKFLISNGIKNILIFLLFAMVFVPVLASAKILPDCGALNVCEYKHLFELINNFIDWVIKISVPTAAAVFAWAGFKYMTTGVVDQKAAAKNMLVKVFIGFVVILSAWIIVTTITKALLANPSIVPVEGS